jgi:hypothetical protein
MQGKRSTPVRPSGFTPPRVHVAFRLGAHRSDVLPPFLWRVNASSTASPPATAALPDPQLDEHQTVGEELTPDGCVGLAGGNLAKQGAIDPGQDPPVDDELKISGTPGHRAGHAVSVVRKHGHDRCCWRSQKYA